MRAQGRRDLFPADPGLAVRIVLAAVLTPAIVLAALALLVLVAPVKVIFAVALAGAVGIRSALNERHAAIRGREVSPAEAPELHAAAERLCVMANLPKPRIVVEPEAQPNSWVVAMGRDHASL